MGMADEKKLLDRLGLEAELLDNGCCGMAGSFGFEEEHYDVSLKVGEHELLPAVRQAPKDTLIIANGFSCREQIAQTTDRRALHVAEVMRLALDPPRTADVEAGALGEYPERQAAVEDPAGSSTGTTIALRAATVVAAVAIGSLALTAARARARVEGRRKAD
jgi:hypothetical protein